MSDLNLVVGQTATFTMTFSETAPPPDGALQSDTPAFVTVSLASDLVTGTAVAIGAPSNGTAAVVTISYTGTSAPPDVGPAVVLPGTISVMAAPMAETGNLNLGGAALS
jgi:hypothetical protein